MARRPAGERWSHAREALQELTAAPWVRRCEPASVGVASQVIPHVAQEVAPPPRPRAEHAPRRARITQAMLEEHCLLYTSPSPRD
eukprot:8310364-Alexandrium_andersonii.AAC.1